MTRSRLISSLSGFGILLVLIGHSEAAGFATLRASTDLAVHERFLDLLVDWILTFHMPLFFAISGFLLFAATLRGGERPYAPRALWYAKARRLFAPYLVISSIAYPPKVLLASFAERPVALGPREYLAGLLLPWNNPIIFFWFLPTLFLLFAVAPWVLPAKSRAARDASVMLIGVALWQLFPHKNQTGPGAILNIAGALHNFVFFACGFFAAKYEWLDALTSRRWLGALALLVSCGLLALAPDWVPAQLVMAFAGIIFACVVARSFEPRFAALGVYSFPIFLFSWFPQVCVKVLAGRVPQMGFSVAVALSVLAGVFAPLAIARIVYPRLRRDLRFWLGGDDVDRAPAASAVRQTVVSSRDTEHA